jgi:hypothetical protein
MLYCLKKGQKLIFLLFQQNYWFRATTLCTGWQYHEIWSFGSLTKSADQISSIWPTSKKSNRMTKEFSGSNVAQISWVADEKWDDFLKWWPNIWLWLQKDGLLQIWSSGLRMLWEGRSKQNLMLSTGSIIRQTYNKKPGCRISLICVPQ